MHIDELLTMPDPQSIAEKQWQYQNLAIPTDWSQGRTAYGGCSAGMVYAAIHNLVDAKQVLRAFTVNFVGPVELNSSFDIHVENLRTGKNVAQFMGRIVQNGQTCVLCQAVFGYARQSVVIVENHDKHTMQLPSKAKFIPQIPKITPKFLRHFELSIDQGGMPFTRNKSSHYYGWMRYKDAPEQLSTAHLISIIDAWPPTLLQMLKWPAPASTVSWHIDFLQPLPTLLGDRWLAYQANTRQAQHGYGHAEATIWDENGQVLALSRQTVAIFD